MPVEEFTTNSVEETIALGERIGTDLQPGDVIALSGDLGAGKTHFCKGVAKAFGVDPDIVNSPTFVLLQTYEGRLPIHHFDTYRLGGAAEFEDIGGIELLDGSGVCLVEWPERIAELLPERTLRISIIASSAESRQVRIG